MSGVDSQIRQDWLFTVTRECQVFLGSAGALDRTTFSATVREFAQSMALPRTRFEALLLRGLLLDLALQWGELDHNLFHREISNRHCRFLPSRVIARAWTHTAMPAADAFSHWAVRYEKEFASAHPNALAGLTRHRIDTDFASRIRIGDLASRGNCSAATLSRQFQKVMGCSIHDYQTRVRALQAVQLLRTTGLSIRDIARRIGYASRKDVYRVLRRAGYPTPSQLRQRSRHDQRKD